MSDEWNPVAPYPEGGREIEFQWKNGRVERMKLLVEGQWSASHWGDLIGYYPPGAITGWRYVSKS